METVPKRGVADANAEKRRKETAEVYATILTEVSW